MILEYINETTNISQLNVFWLFYLVIIILSAAVYKLGFAKKLPVLKAALTYVMLAVGSIVLAILGTQMPIAEILFFSVIGLAIYRFQRWRLGSTTGRDDVDVR